ncbi:hypothetical protein GCM10010260_60150 [Streptomyces filipinensis]|uniref:Uncharacterized protein n=1 Tax=Streptomyces filipinensis TaxID=66887 RepID=A0A918IHD2_9ACTN|nr:hypothetical protein [Streptomyces filipinensis]GGV13161.1 hypothetical protein GCM10010260_60150 [Streptomyces filipinensis]
MAVLAVAATVAGCGSGKEADGNPKASDKAASPTAEKLAADPGIRYTKVVPPAMEGLVCDEGDGGFRFGSDLDIGVYGDDGLKEIADDSGDVADEISCFGSPRIVLRKGTRSASAPTFTARTTLYENVPDPTASLAKIFDHSMKLSVSYGRNLTGKPQISTSRSMVAKCQQNVTDTFPMTTCFWANYRAVGAVDFFPPDGQYVPIASAAALTKDFVGRALKGTGGS